MAQIMPVIRAELDPSRPVPEICAVINAVTPFHPGQEKAILKGVKDSIEVRLKQLEKGDAQNGKQVREHSRG